ncbi:hypothetical protein PLEOSDRAFT_1089788 [Pleurotus ostreatus PC15]|uniref:RING-type domain-containing protein n=1 Tax=Pleurotus ostreatus (strain PC15) TaxID=1137138 RepID=A0A067NER4_PLEO1|nr:hypothetical protein PLEOSDRAFT_1089788 [Pleurotus ostreatus PC15]
MPDCDPCNDFVEKWITLPCGHFQSTGCVQSTVDAPQFTCPICEVPFDRSSNHGVVRPLRLPHATSPDKNDGRGMSCDDINNRIPSSSAFKDKIAVLEKEEKLLTAELDLLEKEWLFLNMLAKIKHVCRPDGIPVLKYFARKKRKRQKERIQANVSLLIRSFIWYAPNAVLLIIIYVAEVNVSLAVSAIISATAWSLIIILGHVLND